MLYDNSQLARVYLHVWQVTGNEFFRTITEEILDYVVREMLDDSGGFHSTQDADSEGEEGKFFTWTPDEIREVLVDEADAFMVAYGVTPGGNFEGKNILAGSVSAGLWTVASGAELRPFAAAGDCYRRRSRGRGHQEERIRRGHTLANPDQPVNCAR